MRSGQQTLMARSLMRNVFERSTIVGMMMMETVMSLPWRLMTSHKAGKGEIFLVRKSVLPTY